MRTIIICAIAIALVLWFQPARAQQCAPSEKVQEGLAKEYKESLTAGGLATSHDKKVMIQIWTSKNGETWTIIMARPDGMSCYLAGGEHWGEVEWKEPKGEGL